MWTPKYLILKNILSHEDTRIDFNGEVINITGENLTDVGQKSNGSGKSSVVDGFSLALLDKPTKYNSNKKCIRRGESSGEVDLFLENSFLNKTLLIQRKYFKSKAGKVIITEDGIEREDLKDLKTAESNKEILDIIGVSEDDIKSYYILTNSTHTPFFGITDGAKKKVINRFSNIEVIDPIIEDVKKDISSLNDELQDFEKEKIVLETKIESEDLSVEDLIKQQEKWKSELGSDKNRIEDKIKCKEIELDEIEGNIKSLQDHLEDLSIEFIEKEIRGFKSDINKSERFIEHSEEDLKDVNDARSVEDGIFNGMSESINEIKGSNKSIEVKIKSLKSILDGKLSCPDCSHEFVPSHDKTIKEIEEEINLKEKELSKNLKEIDSLNNKLKKVSEKIEKLKAEDVELSKVIQELEKGVKNIKKKISLKEDELGETDRISRTIKNKHSEKEDILLIIDKLKKDLEEFNPKDIYKSQIESSHKKTKKFKKDLSDVLLDINDVKVDISETSEWIGLFKSFKSNLANQAISSIEDNTNYILEKLNTDLTVNIEGYRLLANGKDLKEEISITIDRPTDTGKSFDEFSGGEKARINLSNVLANQEMINSSSKTGGLDLLVIDEVMDSLDEYGLSSVLNALYNLNKNIIVISHVKTQSFANEIVVQKIDNISKIKEEIIYG